MCTGKFIIIEREPDDQLLCNPHVFTELFLQFCTNLLVLMASTDK